MQPTQAPPLNMDDSAALLMLATPVLWRTVAGFMHGWPLRVAEFVHQTKATAAKRNTTFPMQRGWLVHAAIAARDFAVLQALVAMHTQPHYADIEAIDCSYAQRCAVAFQHIDVLEWLCMPPALPPSAATKQGHGSQLTAERTFEPELLAHAVALAAPDVALLDWLVAHCPATSIALTSEQVDHAAATGNTTLVHWLHTHAYVFTARAIDSAAASGNLDVVRYLHTHRTDGCTTDAMDNAAAHGHLDVVQFLHTHRTEGCTTQALDGAAENGHVAMMQFLLAHRTEGFSTTKPIAWTPRNTTLAVVQLLHTHRATGWTTAAIDRAAGDGQLDVVRFLLDHRTDGCTTFAMDTAASRGFLDVVALLHASGRSKCTTYAMDSAAREGHLDVVRYLHTHRTEGCTKAALTQALLRGHVDVVRFLLAQRTEGFVHTAATETAAARLGVTQQETQCVVDSNA